jgi:hypothetical protein
MISFQSTNYAVQVKSDDAGGLSCHAAMTTGPVQQRLHSLRRILHATFGADVDKAACQQRSFEPRTRALDYPGVD